MATVDLYESVPNFSEGRDRNVIDTISTAAAGPAHFLDEDFDPDHNRVVVTLLGTRTALIEGLLRSVSAAAQLIDIRKHAGVHPRVGVADVIPIVPMGAVTLDACHEVARELGELIWSRLRIPVYLYGHGEEWTLADIRAGRAQPSHGGSSALHPTAGAVCVGARRLLVAFNVLLPGLSLSEASAIARSLRESRGGMRGVQALVFDLPGGRVQLSMNLFRVDETPPAALVEELQRRGVEVGRQQLVGLCPAAAANQAASGRILEARIGATVARAGAARARGDDEGKALARKLRAEADSLAELKPSQEDLLAGAERCAALPPVLRAAGMLDAELDAMARLAALGLRDALDASTRSTHAARMAALRRRLTSLEA